MLRSSAAIPRGCRKAARQRGQQQRCQSQCAKLSQKSVLEISGPDSTKFLKGLLCRDVEGTHGGYSGFLNASGRVLHDVFVYPIPPQSQSERYLIIHESPPDHPVPLEAMLPPFRLRSKVKFRDVSTQWSVWALWGEPRALDRPSRSWRVGGGGSAEPIWTFPGRFPNLQLHPSEIGCWDLRAGAGLNSLGKRILVPQGQTPSFAFGAEEVCSAMYKLHRMERGVPEGPSEIIPEVALPLESCMDLHGGVDFRKGCYVGQELTVRTYHTGVTRKRILPVRIFSLEDPDRGVLDARPGVRLPPKTIEITYHPEKGSSSQKPKSAGRLLALHDTAGSVGLALMRLELASRSWLDDCKHLNVGEMRSRGHLTMRADDQDWGLLVDKGAALRSLDSFIENHATL